MPTARKDEYKAWRKPSLRGKVYGRSDGVPFNVRLEDDLLACLTRTGMRQVGTREMIAREDGYGESSESWKTLLHDLKRRGLRPLKMVSPNYPPEHGHTHPRQSSCL